MLQQDQERSIRKRVVKRTLKIIALERPLLSPKINKNSGYPSVTQAH